MSPPIVYVLTSNERKRKAWAHDLRRYRVDLRFAEPTTVPEELLRDERVLAVCREQSDLYEHGTDKLSAREDLAIVDNVCVIDVHTRAGSDKYREVRKGYIDRRYGAKEDENGWWDSIFRSFATHQTYDEMAAAGTLRSSRDMAVSRFILDRFHFSGLTKQAHGGPVPETAVDFSVCAEDVFEANPLLNGPWVKAFGIRNILDQALDEGVYFRAAKSPRERNYWCPPFSGIPLVPKKDAVHETTYMVHDIGHQLLPDLLVSPPCGDLDRRLYVAQRMISEAMTIVLSDMVYVDALRREGVDYDFTKRRVYPLFQATRIDLGIKEEFLDNVCTLLLTNVRHCVLGDMEAWPALVGPDCDAFAAYRAKYDSFFIEDFRWTVRNWDNMMSIQPRLQRWSETLPSRMRSVLPKTTAEMVEALSAHRRAPIEFIVEALFVWNWEHHVRPAILGRAERVSRVDRTTRAFHRWLSGQLGLFAQFEAVPEAPHYLKAIQEYVLSHSKLGLPEIQRVREFYNTFVDLLAERALIDLDDRATFKSVYPLFEPFYVFYDRKIETTLSSIAHESLK